MHHTFEVFVDSANIKILIGVVSTASRNVY